MFEITKNAANQINLAASQSDVSGMSIRIAVIKKPDGSLDYRMGYDESKSHDIKVVPNDIEVIFTPNYENLLKGTLMDYVELEPGKFNFIFMNPNDANYTPPQD